MSGNGWAIWSADPAEKVSQTEQREAVGLRLCRVVGQGPLEALVPHGSFPRDPSPTCTPLSQQGSKNAEDGPAFQG